MSPEKAECNRLRVLENQRRGAEARERSRESNRIEGIYSNLISALLEISPDLVEKVQREILGPNPGCAQAVRDLIESFQEDRPQFCPPPPSVRVESAVLDLLDQAERQKERPPSPEKGQ